jgi:plastocyanin
LASNRTLVASVALTALALCAAGVVALAGSQSPKAPKPATHTVVMDGTSFEPANVTVNTGDTVVWVNEDPFSHTVTSKAGGFDSKVIPEGKAWTNTMKAKGTFPYICTLHPTMKGVLRVK